MNQKQKTFSIYTLGCKLNFTESVSLSKQFESYNYKEVSFNEKADIYLINTCSVTNNSNKKSRNAISRARTLNPDSIIIVTGCYAQLKPEEIKDKINADYIIGIDEKSQLSNILENVRRQTDTFVKITDYKTMNSFFPSFDIGSRTRAFLKIQDGCDYFCSYCTIPFARGRSRNQSIYDTLEQIEAVAQQGVKEIVITGVNIGDFGKSTNESFTELLTQISKKEKSVRIRLGSIEPDLLHEEIIHLVAETKNIMPHFHIPLQSGSNDMLKLMKRRYNVDLFDNKINLINKLVPNAFIGIDLIVGVNGETEKMFCETQEYLNSIKFSSAHVFAYSERDNTLALNFLPKHNSTIKKQRADIVKNISSKKYCEFVNNNLHKSHSVLVDSHDKNGYYSGFSENYINIKFKNDFNIKQLKNKIVNIEINELNEKNQAFGKII